jgi:hypothetical protein
LSREPFGLGDSRAGGYVDVSSGRPPTGPDKDAGPALVSLESGAGPGSYRTNVPQRSASAIQPISSWQQMCISDQLRGTSDPFCHRPVKRHPFLRPERSMSAHQSGPFSLTSGPCARLPAAACWAARGSRCPSSALCWRARASLGPPGFTSIRANGGKTT